MCFIGRPKSQVQLPSLAVRPCQNWNVSPFLAISLLSCQTQTNMNQTLMLSYSRRVNDDAGVIELVSGMPQVQDWFTSTTTVVVEISLQDSWITTTIWEPRSKPPTSTLSFWPTHFIDFSLLYLFKIKVLSIQCIWRRLLNFIQVHGPEMGLDCAIFSEKDPAPHFPPDLWWGSGVSLFMQLVFSPLIEKYSFGALLLFSPHIIFMGIKGGR